VPPELSTLSGVSSLPASIATAAALFAGTNVDDMVVLALLSSASRAAGRPRRWEIWAGQFAGFAIITAVSVAAGRGLDLIPAHWLWLLALIPLTLGVVTLIAAVRAARAGERPPPPAPGGVFGVAGLTITNGADDIAAYTPFFAASDAGRIVVTLVDPPGGFPPHRPVRPARDHPPGLTLSSEPLENWPGRRSPAGS